MLGDGLVDGDARQHGENPVHQRRLALDLRVLVGADEEFIPEERVAPAVTAYVKRSPSSEAAVALLEVAEILVGKAQGEKGGEKMKFAIPLAGGRLSMHFGHCEEFALVETEDGKVAGVEKVEAPEHAPGLLPKWLAEKGVNDGIDGRCGTPAGSAA